ncbi:AAA family ATPase [Peribacillus frigoritolerans]|uniref:ATP-dependent nuclease n=1 Tax=Peribacillus frigoritolerans TaxID=450367 RepID=UPI003D273AFF
MLINEIELKGWRYYSEENGIKLKNFKKINLIIGPNNVGKSNFLKYFLKLRSVFPEGDDSFKERNFMSLRLKDNDKWLNNEMGKVFCEIKLENSVGHRLIKKDIGIIKMKASHDHTIGEIPKNNFEVLNPVLNKYNSENFWVHFMSNHIRFITDIRGLKQNTVGIFNIHLHNEKIMRFLLEKTAEQNWIKEYEKKMTAWLQKILLEDELVFNFYADGENSTFTIETPLGNKGNEIIFDHNDLGTGVSHLVLILTRLYSCQHRKINIFLEEPEMNLHPQSISELADILKNDFPNLRFFIFSHSNIWIDKIDSDYSVYNFYKSKEGSTECIECSNGNDYYSIFENLGIRPSQLLLSNFNIWIEGPSDRIYINHWIKKFSEPYKLIEGKHYSYSMYGGTNLAHYDFVFNDLINILSTGYNSAIICDSDKSKDEDEFKKRVCKIKDRIEQENLSRVMLWITEGREIENYIPQNLFEETLVGKFPKNHFEFKKEKIKLERNNKGPKEYFSKYLSYDDFFTSLYEISKKDTVSKKAYENFKEEIDKKKEGILKNISKVDLAKQIVGNWRDEYSYDENNLSIRMIELVKRIKEANNIQG